MRLKAIGRSQSVAARMGGMKRDNCSGRFDRPSFARYGQACLVTMSEVLNLIVAVVVDTFAEARERDVLNLAEDRGGVEKDVQRFVRGLRCTIIDVFFHSLECMRASVLQCFPLP